MIARLSCRRWCRRHHGENCTIELVGEEGPDHDKTLYGRVPGSARRCYGSGKRTHKESGGTGSGLSGTAEAEKVTDRKREGMYLKSIEVQGFKSFANKIRI